jgi:predicted GTPase
MIKYSQQKEAMKKEDAERQKSLFKEKRKRDAARVKTQNEELYHRIHTKTPFYNRTAWEQDRKKNLGYLKNISLYPKQYVKIINDFNADETEYKKYLTSHPKKQFEGRMRMT